MSNTIVNPAMEIKFVRLYFSEGILGEGNKDYFFWWFRGNVLSCWHNEIPFTFGSFSYAATITVNVS
ncbi:hypothetical protein, partial [Cedecea neteri]